MRVFMQQVNGLTDFSKLQQKLEPPATATTACQHGSPVPLSRLVHHPTQPPGSSHCGPIPGPTWPSNPNGCHVRPIRMHTGELWPPNHSRRRCLGGGAGAAGWLPQQAEVGRKILISSALGRFVGWDFTPAPFKYYESFWCLL